MFYTSANFGNIKIQENRLWSKGIHLLGYIKDINYYNILMFVKLQDLITKHGDNDSKKKNYIGPIYARQSSKHFIFNLLW